MAGSRFLRAERVFCNREDSDSRAENLEKSRRANSN
jgi:hypothetical protein